MEKLINLAQKCHKAFIETQNNFTLRKYLIEGTLPILYFGDINAYFQSRYKVITVAINPSYKEFISDSTKKFSYIRFPQFESIPKENTLDYENALQYLSALNNYFKTGNDYKIWFDKTPRRNLFAPFGVSYYDNAPNRAIHTDILSPFATSCKWSEIKSQVIQKQFIEVGFCLWRELLEILKPDIIFMSLNKKYINHIDFYQTFYDYLTYPNKKGLTIQHGYININGKNIHIFNESKPNVVPFDAIDNKHSESLGKKIFEDFDSGVLDCNFS